MDLARLRAPHISGVLERERLLGKLAGWSDKKVVLIQGPAGQGKSTLAADHARSLGASAVWYSLAAGDDDPNVFLTGFGQAVQHAFPRRLPKAPPVPRDPFRSGAPTPAVAQWIERLFQDIPAGLVILDDCHLLAASRTLPALLNLLIEVAPRAVRFLVLSRTLPELSLAGLRARRAVAELTGADLRFTDSEVSDLFGSVFGTPLVRSQAARITAMTEGWAVGLVLVHEYLSAGSGDDILAGYHRLPDFQEQVFDYLADEVFAHLPNRLQEFLLRTSLADSLPLPLAAELCALPMEAPKGRESVRTMLRELARRNLFIDQGTADRTVRYHALFREFLARRLAATGRAAEVRRLSAIAARYFQRAGDPAQAADLLIRSGQPKAAARILERSGGGLVARGRLATLLRMIDKLPPSLQKRPWFLFARAVDRRFSDSQQALALYDRALSGFRAERDGAGQMLSLGGVVEAAFHGGGDFRRMARAAVQAKKLLRESSRGSRIPRATLALALGTAEFFTGRLDRGIVSLRQAMDLFRAAGDPFSQISCAIYLAPCALYHGDFRTAREAVQRGFEAQRSAPDEPGGAAALFLVQAMTHLFAGDFAAAQESLDAGRRLAAEYRIASIDLLLLVIGGWIAIARGDYPSAEQLLDECRRHGEDRQMLFFSRLASHLLSLACLFQRKLERAKKLSDHAVGGGRTNSGLFQGIYLIASGAIHRELGDDGRAEQDLRAALRLLAGCNAAQQEANAHLILAGLYRRQDRAAAVLRHLRKGLSIGRERGFTYYAPLAPRELQEHALEAAANGICRDYCAALLDRRQPAAASPFLRVHCLGGFRVERNGVPVPDREWKGRLAKRLVKLLAVQNSGHLSRDAVSEVLWPDSAPDRRSAAFSSLLHRLRKTLDHVPARRPQRSCIRFEDNHLSLDRSLALTDVETFQASLAAATRAESGKAPERAVRLYDQAIGLYRGDLLPEDLYEDWCAPARETLRAGYLKALDRAAALSEGMDDGSRAAHYHERLFAVDPCNEAACRWLMTHALAAGRRGEAVRTYERCQLALRRELDIEPDERTKRLYRSIIGG